MWLVVWIYSRGTRLIDTCTLLWMNRFDINTRRQPVIMSLPLCAFLLHDEPAATFCVP